ncbi:hypothetical protein WKI71_43760 [Streptomyces sp. MS1.AVA.1]|uniref:Uncharacterized protein n=1 Tax=Streptomyces machairae TaxID=3134109 RepID=A0ABU8UV62_9ACTN
MARTLGFDHSGPLDARTGRAMTLLVQGQAHLIPLTVSAGPALGKASEGRGGDGAELNPLREGRVRRGRTDGR